jgi:integrase
MTTTMARPSGSGVPQTLATFVDLVAQARISKRVQGQYASICRRFLTWLEADLGRHPTVEDFTLEAALGWLEERATSGGRHGSGAAPGTLLVNRSVLRQLALAAGQPAVAEGLARFVPQPAPPATIAPAQYQQLLRAPDRRSWLGARDFAIIRLLGDAGVGPDEVRGLRVGDLIWDAAGRRPAMLRVTGGSGRTVALSGPVAAALAAWLARHPNRPPGGGQQCWPRGAAPLFIRAGANGWPAGADQPYGLALTARVLRGMLQRHARQAGLPPQLARPDVLGYYWACRQTSPTAEQATPGGQRPVSIGAALDATANDLPDLVNAAEIERRQFGMTGNGQRILRLVREDPRFPQPLPSTGREPVWSWTLQVRPYFDPAAVELVTAAEIARRVVALGYRRGISSRRVHQLARQDRQFPRPLPSSGMEILWLWGTAEAYFRTRDSTPARGRIHGQRQKPTGDGLPLPPAGADGRPDLVNAPEIAKRVVAAGYAATMSRQGIWALSRDDPKFPDPWPTTGWEQLWSWSQQIQPYFAARHDRRATRSASRAAGGGAEAADQPESPS